jgi:hypothetical protein
VTDENRRPARGPESRRYERYVAAGTPIHPTRKPKKPEASVEQEPTEAEKQRQFDKDHRNLNKGIPTHRGADQATHDAVTKGLHGSEPEGTPEERARERQISGTNHGIPEHRGFTKDDAARIKKAAQDEREVE